MQRNSMKSVNAAVQALLLQLLQLLSHQLH
jgi:hypothetical protein